MNESRTVLKHVGVALVIVGILDVALMVYCIATGRAYASSLNLFAVVGGIFLLRGSLATARVVAHFGSFLLGAIATLLLAIPIVVPFSFFPTLIWVYPLTTGAYLIATVSLVVFLWWTSRNLAAPSVARDFARAKLKPIRLLPPAALGSALVLLVALFVEVSVRTDAARDALAKIEQEHGTHQRYFISSLQSSGGAVEAIVIGYTNDQISSYPVSWGKE